MTLSFLDYFAVSPLLILVVTSLLLLLVEAYKSRAHTTLWSITIAGLIAALVFASIAPESTNPLIANWLYFDSLSRFFSLLFITIGIAVCLMASSFFKQFHATRGEFFFFIVASLFGLILLSSAKNFLTLFLGLETLSISLYVLTNYVKTCTNAHEASFKYFILGSISTALLLFGIAMVYAATGTTAFDALAPQFALLSGPDKILFFSGMSLISVSLLFKAAIVPFHIWAPDVYAGAPTAVTAFMAVATKAGAFAVLIRLFLSSLGSFDPAWQQIASLLVYPTLLWANFVAMRTLQLRRFFAYSGISHAGFLLIPLAASTPESAPCMLFYIVVYTVATLGAFACLCFLDTKSEGVMLDDLRGLFYTSPTLTAMFTLCLLTLGGIPPMIGFFAKFYILKIAFTAGLYGIVIIALLTTILSAYYYLRIVAALFSEKQADAPQPARSARTALAATLCCTAIIAISIYPEPLMQLVSAIWKV